MAMRARLHRRAGFTLIELLIVIAVIAILAGIAVPQALSSRRAGEETSAIGSLKVINQAEASYRARNASYTTLSNLVSVNLVDQALGAATATGSLRAGYYFQVTVPSINQFYVVAARPAPLSSDRQFYTDESGEIFAAPALTASPTSDFGGILPGASFFQLGN